MSLNVNKWKVFFLLYLKRLNMMMVFTLIVMAKKRLSSLNTGKAQYINLYARIIKV